MVMSPSRKQENQENQEIKRGLTAEAAVGPGLFMLGISTSYIQPAQAFVAASVVAWL
jgi:hypothetical protein